MTAKEFLRNKGILKEGHHHWVVKFEDGNEVDIVDLLEEFKDGKVLQAVVEGKDLLFMLSHVDKTPRKSFQERLDEEMEKKEGQVPRMKNPPPPPNDRVLREGKVPEPPKWPKDRV